MKRILFCGTRDIQGDSRPVQELLSLTLAWLGLEPEDVILVHGGARGADTLGNIAAARLGIMRQHYRPDWDRYGKSAGFKRNIQMLDSGIDLVIALWDGESRGTAHTIAEAKKRNIPGFIVRPERLFPREES